MRRDILKIIELGHGIFHERLPSRETVLSSLAAAAASPVDIYAFTGSEGAADSFSSSSCAEPAQAQAPTWFALFGGQVADDVSQRLRAVGVPLRNTQWLWNCISAFDILPEEASTGKKEG